MNGTGPGSPYSDHFHMQHRMRSMSWCEGGELSLTTGSNQQSDNMHINLGHEEVMVSTANSMIRSDSVELPACSNEVINLKKPSARKNAWGCLSYADLIAKAIESSPNQRLTLNQIYSWMVENVPYFRAKGQTNSSAGWKNSIRHNLSLHGRFVRVQNEGAGKSSWWMVNNNNRLQKTPRRRSTTMDSKTFERKKKANPKDAVLTETHPLQNNVPSFHAGYNQFHHQQPSQLYQHPQQHALKQPLDSFETAFRPVDRQQQYSGFTSSGEDLRFPLKVDNNLNFIDNYNNNVFSNNNFSHSNSCISSNNQMYSSLQSLTPVTVRNVREHHQHPDEPGVNIGTAAASMSSRLTRSNIPDFFKLPDEAWRQYLPPSPDGLTETVISSESLTALLEAGHESEIVDLVPPAISAFDEELIKDKRRLNVAGKCSGSGGGGAECSLVPDKTQEKVVMGSSGDCVPSFREMFTPCESTLVLPQLHLLPSKSTSTFASVLLTQENKEHIDACSTPVLRHVLTASNLDLGDNVANTAYNRAEENFSQTADVLSDFVTGSGSNVGNDAEIKEYPHTSEGILFVQQERYSMKSSKVLPSRGYISSSEDCQTALPYLLPLNVDSSAPAAVTTKVPSPRNNQEIRKSEDEAAPSRARTCTRHEQDVVSSSTSSDDVASSTI